MPNKTEIDSMARLIALMNAAPDEAAVPPDISPSLYEAASSYAGHDVGADIGAAYLPPAEAVRPPASRALSGDPGVQAMKSILQRFHQASDSLDTGLREEAAFDPELRRALMTERTPTGARVGQWEIRVSEDVGRSYYAVARVGEETLLASDLALYEAAHGLVVILNEGGTVNSSRAMDLLNAERDYASALHDAILFRHRMVKRGNPAKQHVYEDRYDAAKSRAVRARGLVERLARGRSG